MDAGDSEDRLVRAFVALPIPPGTRERVAVVQERLRNGGGVKWVEPENLHFTLRFLGYAERRTLDALRDALSGALVGVRAFRVVLEGVGAFPSRRRPKVVWIGVSEGASELESLAGTVERAAVAAGFPPEERPFRAHLTLGRVKAERPPHELVRVLEAEPADMEVDRMEATEVVLVRSELRRAGPIYTPLASFPLREAEE